MSKSMVAPPDTGWFPTLKRGIDMSIPGPIRVRSTNNDFYQFSTPNGYILQNLVNFNRLRKLSLSEIEQYPGEFWNASKHLKLYDLQVKETHPQ